jgi:hypothetical protein
MNQSKLGSLYESAINIVIGAVVALLSQLIVFPMFGIDVPLSANIGIMMWFTLISVIRSYVVRRWFNDRLRRAVLAMAGDSDD